MKDNLARTSVLADDPADKGKKASGTIWRFLLRLLVSASLIAFIFRTTKLKLVLKSIALLPAYYTLFIVLVYLLGQLISSQKWRLFLKELEIGRTRLETLRAYFIGMCINTFGLGTVGGDAARVIALQPEKAIMARAVGSVLGDRVQGLAVLAAIGAVAALVTDAPVVGPYALPSLFAVVLGTLAWWGLTILFKRPDLKIYPLLRKLTHALPLRPGFLAQITVYSIVFHLSQIFIYALVAHGLGVPIPFSLLLATVPLINIASCLPISINGIGVREGLAVALFVPLGMTNEQAVAMGVLWLVGSTLASALVVPLIFLLPAVEAESFGGKPLEKEA